MTLDDVLETIANECGIYGSHVEVDTTEEADCRCRSCWLSYTKVRILEAVEVEKLLSSRIGLQP